jgi:hypothetical protein
MDIAKFLPERDKLEPKTFFRAEGKKGALASRTSIDVPLVRRVPLHRNAQQRLL